MSKDVIAEAKVSFRVNWVKLLLEALREKPYEKFPGCDANSCTVEDETPLRSSFPSKALFEMSMYSFSREEGAEKNDEMENPSVPKRSRLEPKRRTASLR